MMLFLTEDDVRQLLTMDDAIAAVFAVFRDRAAGKARNISRGRAQTDQAMLHLLGGAADGMVGYKAYATSKQGANFQIGLFDGASGQPLALLQADLLGQIRTGAASGVATQTLARSDARVVGLFGTGKQAKTQAWAVCRVRPIDKIRVFSRNDANRRAFASEMAQICGCDIEPVTKPEDVVKDCDIVITATASKTPVFEGAWLKPGVHLNVVGSNFLNKTEIDVETVRRASIVAVDDIDQAKSEAGDFVAALAEGVLTWDRVQSLADIVSGSRPGRGHEDDVTLFKSLGLGMEDVAVAAIVYRLAMTKGMGRTIAF
jgi:alanine dehydrogenase